MYCWRTIWWYHMRCTKESSSTCVGFKKDELDKRSFPKLLFANKYLDVINIGNILHHNAVKSNILPFLKDQSVLIIYNIRVIT